MSIEIIPRIVEALHSWEASRVYFVHNYFDS